MTAPARKAPPTPRKPGAISGKAAGFEACCAVGPQKTKDRQLLAR